MRFKNLPPNVQDQLLTEWCMYARLNGISANSVVHDIVKDAYLAAAARYYPQPEVIRQRVNDFLSSEKGQELIITLSA